MTFIDQIYRTPPKTLYHYTTLAGIKGIIESQSFWLSSAIHLNDPLELRYLDEMVERRLRERHGESAVAEMLSRVYEDAGSPIEKFELAVFHQAYRTIHISPTGASTFCISFSERYDDIPHWRLYADEGTGVCLHVNTAQLDAHFALLIYQPDQQVALFDALTSFHESQQGSAQERLGRACDDYYFIRAVCKSPYFSHENEWRLFNVWPNDRIQFRVAERSLVPYLSMPVPLDAISHITFGPRCDADVMFVSMSLLWDSIGAVCERGWQRSGVRLR